MRRYTNALSIIGVVALIGGAFTAWALDGLQFQSGGQKLIASGSSAEIEMQTGTTFDHQSGATLVLHGLTFTSTEMGYLDGITAGQSLNSKAATYSATGKHTVAAADTIDVDGQLIASAIVILDDAGITTMGQGFDGLDTLALTGVVATDICLATAQDTLSTVRAWCDTDLVYFQFEFTNVSDVQWAVFRPE